MTGLIDDGSLGFARPGGGGREASPQTVPGKIFNTMPQPPNITLDHHRHSFAREPLIENLPMAIHHPEQWPGVALRRGSHILHSRDRAGGLVLATGNADESSLPFLR